MLPDDIKLYLPKFLSDDDSKELQRAVSAMLAGTPRSYYTNRLTQDPILYQGDGIINLPYLELPRVEIKDVNAMVLSNTCDVDPENPRDFPQRVLYAPIMSLAKYRAGVLGTTGKTGEQVDAHLEAIRQQHITQVFYLPPYPGKMEESLVYMDRIVNIGNSNIDRATLPDQRIFTLSDFGAWLFVLKLSIHFSRV
jgi:hypothetical protein